ncbi:MAG: tetratricopeptide repeat protein, partial [Myxococcota bacterium]
PLELGSVAYTFRPLGIPVAFTAWLAALCFLGYVTTTGVAFGWLARQAGLRALGPALAIAFSQALWFVVPIMLRGSRLGESIAPLASVNGEYVFVWISFAHALQYLWVTSTYAKRTSDYRGGPRYYAVALVAGSAIWGLPTVLFLPSMLGTHAFDAGLYALVAATVNLHHFVLDGAVWKLRDGRIARALLGSAAERAGAETRASMRYLGFAFLAFGAVYAVVNLTAMLETGWSLPRALERGDRERAETAARRLHWLGRDSMDTHLQIANLRSREGDLAGARAAVVRSLEITPSALGYVNVGILDAGEERLDEAQRAFEQALALEPGMLEASYRMALVAWRRGDREGSLRLLEEAASRAPERDDIRAALERAREAARTKPAS